MNDKHYKYHYLSPKVIKIPVDPTDAGLVLGEAMKPGSDNEHFCKPTDVAVASNGHFFVSDG